MVYPVIKPPVHVDVFFDFEGSRKASEQQSIADPNLHPLFGISISGKWPNESEYQHAYSNRCSPNSVSATPTTCPCNPALEELKGCRDCVDARAKRSKVQRFDQLYDPTPLPLLDKHYKGNYYKISDPIGVVTREEITKCRETPMGPEHLGARNEMENTYLPNYRYKEWVQQPHGEIQKQIDQPGLVCRLPDPQTLYWDMYNQVRMNRPSPKLSDDSFSICRTVPIPRR